VSGGYSARAARIVSDGRGGAGEGRAPAGYGRGRGGRPGALVEEDIPKVSILLQDADIYIGFNFDTFPLPNGQELGEQLRAETDLRIKSGTWAAATAPGGAPPTDVLIYLLYTVAPLLTDVYLNVLSSALWDTMKAAFLRQQKENSEATFSIVKMDEEGRTLRTVRGRTDDREIIKDLIRQALKDDET
jgi:hypothetical protein